jgi:hypothetical protein
LNAPKFHKTLTTRLVLAQSYISIVLDKGQPDLQGTWVGVLGGQVWVGKYRPAPNPYPQCRFQKFPHAQIALCHYFAYQITMSNEVCYASRCAHSKAATSSFLTILLSKHLDCVWPPIECQTLFCPHISLFYLEHRHFFSINAQILFIP